MGMGRDKRKAAKARKAAAKAAPVKVVPYEHININNLKAVNNPDPMDEFNDADWRAVARMVIRLERLAREE